MKPTTMRTKNRYVVRVKATDGHSGERTIIP